MVYAIINHLHKTHYSINLQNFSRSHFTVPTARINVILNHLQYILTTLGNVPSVKASNKTIIQDLKAKIKLNKPPCKGCISKSTAEVQVSTFNLFSATIHPLPSGGQEIEFFITTVSHRHRPALLIGSRSPSTLPGEPDEPCPY